MKKYITSFFNWFDQRSYLARLFMMSGLIWLAALTGIAILVFFILALVKLGAVFAFLSCFFGICLVLGAMTLSERQDKKDREEELYKSFRDKWRNKNAEYSRRARDGKI